MRISRETKEYLKLISFKVIYQNNSVVECAQINQQWTSKKRLFIAQENVKILTIFSDTSDKNDHKD